MPPMNPVDGESKDAFVSRCIKHEIDKGHPQDQAAAICYSYWDRHSEFKRWDEQRRKDQEAKR